MSMDRLSKIIGALALSDLPQRPERLSRAEAFQLLPESERLALVKRAGAVPAACGDAIPDAPARGPVRTLDYLASYPKGVADTELKPAGHAGRKTLKCLDVFDRMAAQSARKGGSLALTDSQIGMARIYRTMVEDREAGAVRCSSMEAMPSGSGGTREGFTDHRLDLSRRIDALQARVGSGTALAIRRIRPSQRGDVARANIRDRALIDAVCLLDQDVSAVLLRHGWSNKGDHIKAALAALASALDRMIGPNRRQPIAAVHYGDQPASMFKD